MKTIFLFSLMFLLASTLVVSGQSKNVNFSGSWTLDISTSKLDERARVESMTMTVSHTKNEVKIVSKTVRAPRPAGSAGGTGGGGGFGRGGGFGNGDATATYNLNGKEAVSYEDSPMGKVEIRSRGEFKAGKLHLSSSRTSTGSGEHLTATITEIWTANADRKTITVVREQVTPRGISSSSMVFVKK